MVFDALTPSQVQEAIEPFIKASMSFTEASESSAETGGVVQSRVIMNLERHLRVEEEVQPRLLTLLRRGLLDLLASAQLDDGDAWMRRVDVAHDGASLGEVISDLLYELHKRVAARLMIERIHTLLREVVDRENDAFALGAK